jgi:muramidase (phage lysozyme)
LPSNPGSRRFNSFKTHPWEGQVNPNKVSDAAGAYQIRYETWKEKFDRGLIAVPAGKDKFGPEVQNRIAAMKLYDRAVVSQRCHVGAW